MELEEIRTIASGCVGQNTVYTKAVGILQKSVKNLEAKY